jgi:hypothetical protein
MARLNLKFSIEPSSEDKALGVCVFLCPLMGNVYWIELLFSTGLLLRKKRRRITNLKVLHSRIKGQRQGCVFKPHNLPMQAQISSVKYPVGLTAAQHILLKDFPSHQHSINFPGHRGRLQLYATMVRLASTA